MTNEPSRINQAFHSSVDYAGALRMGGKTYVILFGWVKSPCKARYALVDDSGSNPAILKATFLPRHDVEEIYGECNPEIQRGYGLVATSILDMELDDKLHFVGITSSGMEVVQSFEPTYFDSFDKFREFVFDLPIASSSFAYLFENVLIDLFSGIDAARPKGVAEEKAYGNIKAAPPVSIVSVANADPDIFHSQLLALTELAKQVEPGEILVILPNMALFDRSVSIATQIHNLTGESIRLINLGRKLNPREQWREAIFASKAKFILFFDAFAVPRKSFNLANMLDYLQNNQDIGMINWIATDAITGADSGGFNGKQGPLSIADQNIQNHINQLHPYNGSFLACKEEMADSIATLGSYIGSDWLFYQLQSHIALNKRITNLCDHNHEIFQNSGTDEENLRLSRMRWYDESLFLHHFGNTIINGLEQGCQE